MRLGHFVSFGIGGADRASFRLIQAQQEMGLSPIVFASEASVPAATRITADQDPNGRVLSIQASYAEIGVPIRFVETYGGMAEADLDILHTHRSGEDNFLLPRLGEKGVAKAVVETNFHGVLKTPADVRVFPSQTLVKFRKIMNQDNYFVIPNPVMHRNSNSSLREEWGISRGKVLGRISRSDRSTYSPKLLLAYKFLKLKHPDLRLVWCGASSWARRDAKRLGLQDIVWVETESSERVVSSWFNSFDIYCHVPKLGETFGNTVAEAMMHAKPVVSLKGRPNFPQAQKEVLDDSDQFSTSLIDFVSKTSRMLSSDGYRTSKSEQNLRRAEANYTPGEVAERYLNVYRWALRNS